ncbi:MAG: hypothetical protein AVDCRST_MAG79-1800 [uncultured Thermoleophilia bacterium]|uniref:Alkaline shock protein 23 n=1 Tax=uncultured Thermoleophilia bacterium TaxID=1497501 RepID=A0A6J4U6G0_9ACTN|nr:MAG: hypothetical protein AVDCRST_MAG79-1800 [uncultured Thermoleophilia bacterium]
MSDHPLIRREGDLQWEITQEALDAAAAAAATSVEGVEVPDRRLAGALRRTHAVEVAETSLRVSLGVVCRYGVVLPTAGAAVQAVVAERLARLTGLEVERVDVTVLAVTRT